MEGAGRGQNNSHTLAIFDPQKVEARGNGGMNFRRSVVVWLSDVYVKFIFFRENVRRNKREIFILNKLLCILLSGFYIHF